MVENEGKLRKARKAGLDKFPKKMANSGAQEFCSLYMIARVVAIFGCGLLSC